MKLLHTSDWHLGQTLHQYEREAEHAGDRPGQRAAPSRGLIDRRKAPTKGTGRSGSEPQPDPLKTSMGYIGADAMQKQREKTARAGKYRPPGGAGGAKGGGRGR